MTELWIIAAAWIGAELVRSLPAIIWSWRCPPHSPRYRCPTAVGRFALPSLFFRRP